MSLSASPRDDLGSRGKLGKWRNSGWGGFGIYGEELADSAEICDLAQTLTMVEQRRKKMNSGAREIGFVLAEVDGDAQDAGVAGKGGAPPLKPPASPMPATWQPAMQNRSLEKSTGLTDPQDRSDRSRLVHS